MKDEILLTLDQEARAVDEQGRWPERSVRALADAGLLGLPLPSDFGGNGTMRQCAETLEKISMRCACTAMIYLMHVCGAQVIVATKSPRRQELLQKIAEGKAVTSLAFSEKGSRSHFWAP